MTTTWMPVKDRVWMIVDRYVPKGHYVVRRHLHQDMMTLAEHIRHDAEDNMRFVLRSRPWWKRIWYAIINKY